MTCNPKEMSFGELERLTRRYASAILPLIVALSTGISCRRAKGGCGFGYALNKNNNIRRFSTRDPLEFPEITSPWHVYGRRPSVVFSGIPETARCDSKIYSLQRGHFCKAQANHSWRAPKTPAAVHQLCPTAPSDCRITCFLAIANSGEDLFAPMVCSAC